MRGRWRPDGRIAWEAGTPLKQQAVLFRASSHSGPLEIELTRRNIPFVKYGGLKFLDSKHAKDLQAIPPLAGNPRGSTPAARVLPVIRRSGPAPAKRAALLHDIGKAVTHEVEGSHALIGAEIARRFDEDPAVVHGIEAHHNEVEPRTVLAVIVQAADAVSAARPGARRETLEGYVKRLERLESIALEFSGVEEVFALQAGREVRVVVDPGGVSDLEARELSRRIARKLEEDLQYPGQIQVTVIREFRATDYAR